MKSDKPEFVDRYLNESEEDKEVLLVSESSDESEVWDCETIVSTYSNLENHPAKIKVPGKPRRRMVPKSVPFPGELGVGKDVIALGGKEKLPVNYLPQRKRMMESLVRERLSSVEKPRKVVGEESKEEKKERKVTYFCCVIYFQILSHFKNIPVLLLCTFE
jgi:protein LTV1